MPFNTAGLYSLPQAAFVPGSVISSTAMNSDLSDIASALTNVKQQLITIAGGGVPEFEILSANRTYYVRTAPLPLTISIASPAVVTWAGHGLAVGDAVVFSVIRTRAPIALGVTITLATPGVVTWTNHGLSINDPIQFDTTGTLPTGMIAGTTYFVSAVGFTTSSFQFSATVGGVSINTSVAQSGTHYCEQVGTMPTNINEGTIYYVLAAGFTSGSFEVATTAGGTAINTAGAVVGRLQGQTGNDSNTGLSALAGAALLTQQGAYTKTTLLNVAGWSVTIQLSNGYYRDKLDLYVGAAGYNAYSGFSVQGNSTTPCKVTVDASNTLISYNATTYIGTEVFIGGMRLVDSVNTGVSIGFNIGYGAQASIHEVEFAGNTFASHIALYDGTLTQTGSVLIKGGGAVNGHIFSWAEGLFTEGGVTYILTGVPIFTPNGFVVVTNAALDIYLANTYTGTTTGPRHLIKSGGSVSGVGVTDPATYFPGSTPGQILDSSTFNDLTSDSWKVLASGATGSDVNTAQAVFPTTGTITLFASKSYEFEAQYFITRVAGTNNHTTAVLFGGTATLTSIAYRAQVTNATGNVLAATQQIFGTAATAVVLTAANTSATENLIINLKGVVRINGAGTLIPQFIYSVAPGGAPTIQTNSYFKIKPLSGTNATTNIGNWS